MLRMLLPGNIDLVECQRGLLLSVTAVSVVTGCWPDTLPNCLIKTASSVHVTVSP